jgi:hypothetical protein
MCSKDPGMIQEIWLFAKDLRIKMKSLIERVMDLHHEQFRKVLVLAISNSFMT